MNIEPGKYYKTRDGRKAKIICIDTPGDYPCVGYITFDDDTCITPEKWQLSGKIDDTLTRNRDLIEEWTEPKKPRLMSPALCCWRDRYWVSANVSANEYEAKQEHKDNFHSWPARDASGNPITYLVPEVE